MQLEQLSDDEIVNRALAILECRLRIPGTVVNSPDIARRLAKLKLAELDHEVFAVMFLDTRHSLISFDILFHGCVDGATVYLSELMKAVLKQNASAIIITHNHPTGDVTPSSADHALTKRIKDACDLMGIRMLDHLVVGGTFPCETYSMADNGDL